jgi:hypothetical protein
MVEDNFIGNFKIKSDGNFGGDDMFDPNPFSGVITRPSKLNTGEVDLGGITEDFEPFDI